MTYLQWYKQASVEDKAAIQALKDEESARTGKKVEAREIILGIMTADELAATVA